MLSALIPMLMVAAVALADPQTPIAPLRIAPAAGGTPIVVTVTGVDQDPVPLTARWNAAETCLADVGCFVSSWLEANSTGNFDHVLALRVPAERAELQKRYADPAIMQRNTTRFNAVRKWSLLGWVEYGDARVVLLVKEDSSSSPTYPLATKRVDGRWAQTDSLATDPGYFEIFDRIGRAVLARHQAR